MRRYIFLVVVIAMVALVVPALANCWDRSSLEFDQDFGCQSSCQEIKARLCNVGDGDMAGTTTWELYWTATGNPKNGEVIATGEVQPLEPEECVDLTYEPGDNPNGPSGEYKFKGYQRPGHPGSGELWSETCSLSCPTAVVLADFAVSSGNPARGASSEPASEWQGFMMLLIILLFMVAIVVVLRMLFGRRPG